MAGMASFAGVDLNVARGSGAVFGTTSESDDEDFVYRPEGGGEVDHSPEVLRLDGTQAYVWSPEGSRQ